MEGEIGKNIKKLKEIFPIYIEEKSGKLLEENEKNGYNTLFATLTEIPKILLKGTLETESKYISVLEELAGDLGYDGNFEITNLDSFNTILIGLYKLAAVPMGKAGENLDEKNSGANASTISYDTNSVASDIFSQISFPSGNVEAQPDQNLSTFSHDFYSNSNSLSFGDETTLSGSGSHNSEGDSKISTITEASSISNNNAISSDKDLNINNSTSPSVKKEEEKKLKKELTFAITLKGKNKEHKIIPVEFKNITTKEAINKVLEAVKKEFIEGYNKTEIPYHPELVGLLEAFKDKLGSKSIITITISEQWLNNIENIPNIKAILQDYERADKKVFLNASDQKKYNELLTKYEVKPSFSKDDLNNFSIPINRWDEGVKPSTEKLNKNARKPNRQISI
jgi:hypothetical protein